jgi:hypothetical protein
VFATLKEKFVRNLFLITLTAGLFCSMVAAQVPTSGNVYFGYSYYHTNLSSIDTAGTNGWVGSLEGKVFPFVGIVADISAHYGSQNFPTAIPPCPVPAPNCSGTINVDVSEHNYLFGPRVSFSAGRFRPFAEAMFGVGHVNANDAGSDTSFATALGGGIDYRIFRPIAWRFEGDYVQTRFFGAHQNNTQLSTGIVFKF